MAKKITYRELLDLIGKYTSDPAVTSIVERAGAKITKTHIVAKTAGFELFILKAPYDEERDSPKIVKTIFLYPKFGEAPTGFCWGSEQDVLASAPKPPKKRKTASSHDKWNVGTLEILADYKNGEVTRYTVMGKRR